MADVVVDSGVLIAIDRGDRAVLVYIDERIRLGQSVIVPAPVVAQVWRGPRNARLARALEGLSIVPLDDHLARAVGLLLGRARTADVVDATVVAVAGAQFAEVLTGDILDIQHLASHQLGVGAVLDVAEVPRVR